MEHLQAGAGRPGAHHCGDRAIGVSRLDRCGAISRHATVAVDDLVNGENVLAEFRGNVTTGGVSRHVVVWSNASQTQNFRLFAEPHTEFYSGTAVTVHNPVVAM